MDPTCHRITVNTSSNNNALVLESSCEAVVKPFAMQQCGGLVLIMNISEKDKEASRAIMICQC
jgi:hypothetical protein